MGPINYVAARRMGFFRRGDDEDPDLDEPLGRVRDDEIVRPGQDRLEALAGGDSLFTSGLSVNEFALLGRLGPQPLAQVMGASVIRTGFQYLPALEPGIIQAGPGYGPSVVGGQPGNRYTEPSYSQIRRYRWHAEVICELDVLTDAWRLARRQALDRLTEEAVQVGADAVVGVHLKRGEHDLGKGTIDFVVTGTAIRLPGSRAQSWPLLTDLSVQDYWKLHDAGHEPVGLVATTAVVFASPAVDVRLRRVRTLASNQELDELSAGFQAARDTARAKLLGQVGDAHGAGAVGVEFSHAVKRERLGVASTLQSGMRRGWHRGSLGIPYFVSGRGDAERTGWTITMHAAGTAVRWAGSPPRSEMKTTMRMGR